ncbi:MAG: hypothetical protein P8173_18395, partial [Gammaproteobacteria bacterium]
LRAAGETVSTLALLDCFAPGVTLKSNYLERLRRLLNPNRVRHLQERLYYRVLQPLGLRRLRHMRTIGEAHRWAHWNYRPRPYPNPIDLFIAAESEEQATDPLLGWGKLAGGDLTVHPIPGTHGLLVKSPHVEVMAEKLQRLLDR